MMKKEIINMDPANAGQAMPAVDSSSMGKGIANEMGDENQSMVTLNLPKNTIDALKQVIADLSTALEQVQNEPGDMDNGAQTDTTGEGSMTDSQKLQQEIAQMSQQGAH